MKLNKSVEEIIEEIKGQDIEGFFLDNLASLGFPMVEKNNKVLRFSNVQSSYSNNDSDIENPKLKNDNKHLDYCSGVEDFLTTGFGEDELILGAA